MPLPNSDPDPGFYSEAQVADYLALIVCDPALPVTNDQILEAHGIANTRAMSVLQRVTALQGLLHADSMARINAAGAADFNVMDSLSRIPAPTKSSERRIP